VRERLGPALGLAPFLSLMTLSILGGCDTLPDYIKEDLQEKRLEETGLDGVDPSGSAPSAGLSILRQIDVEALDAREIGADTTSLGFHRLVHRCGSCHATPSPKIRTAPEWKNAFSRMEKHMKEAGLIPLSEEDRALILAFLQKHAAHR
jgi:hypothetical protein